MIGAPVRFVLNNFRRKASVSEILHDLGWATEEMLCGMFVSATNLDESKYKIQLSYADDSISMLICAVLLLTKRNGVCCMHSNSSDEYSMF